MRTLLWMVLGALTLSACSSKLVEEEPERLLLRVESVTYPLQVYEGDMARVSLSFTVDCPVNILGEKEQLATRHYRLGVYAEILGPCGTLPEWQDTKGEARFELGTAVEDTYTLDILSPEAIRQVTFQPEILRDSVAYRIEAALPPDLQPERMDALLVTRDPGLAPLDTLELMPVEAGTFATVFSLPPSVFVDRTLYFQLRMHFPDASVFEDVPRRLFTSQPAVRVQYF